MQKYPALLGVLLFVGPCFGGDEDGVYGHDSAIETLALGMYGGKKESFPEAVDRGLKLGVVKATSSLTSKTLEKGLGGIFGGISSTFNAVRKTILRSMFKNTGPDVRDLFGLERMLKAGVDTHILNKAKGARVVRAHVLQEQSPSAETPAQVNTQASVQAQPGQLHGVGVLKNDMVYMIAKLDEYEKFYAARPKAAPRGFCSWALDGAAVAGLVYVVGDSFAITNNPVKHILENDKVFIEFVKAQYKEKNTRANKKVEELAGDLNKTIGEQLKRDAQTLDENFKAKEKIIDVGIGDWTYPVRETTCKNVIKVGLVAFAVLRLAQWLRSQHAVEAVTELSDVNRDLVVHLIKSLRSNLQHLVALCDTIKEESDLVRVKDDFEFIGKNCSEALMQIAYLIDLDGAIELQRKGKPGQSAAQQGLGGFGGLPKL